MAMKTKARAKILTIIMIVTQTSHKMSRLACSFVLPNSIGNNMMTMMTTRKTKAKTDLFTIPKKNDNNDDNDNNADLFTSAKGNTTMVAASNDGKTKGATRPEDDNC